MEDITLPDVQDVGIEGDWVVPTDDGDSVIEFNGLLLGVSSSHRNQHIDHAQGTYAARRESCKACRWSEIRLFREVNDSKQFLIHLIGQSIVPGEVMLSRAEWLNAASEVLEALTTRKAPIDEGHRIRPGSVYIAPTAARVLAQAANEDTDIRDVWENRTVY